MPCLKGRRWKHSNFTVISVLIQFEIAGEKSKLLLAYDIFISFNNLLGFMKNQKFKWGALVLCCYTKQGRIQNIKRCVVIVFCRAEGGDDAVQEHKKSPTFPVLNFTQCCGNFKEALNYLGSLTSELWGLILRDAFSVEKQTLLNKDRLVFFPNRFPRWNGTSFAFFPFQLA